jgi:putative copper resistance protein D
LQSAWIRLGSLGALGTSYGAIVVVKATALALLGLAGWRQRRLIARRLTDRASNSAAFLRLALGELLVMGLAVGAAVTLSRSAPPVPDRPPSPGRVLELTGYPDPGPLRGLDWLTAWRTDWLFVCLSVLMIGLYAAGVRRLRRRGDPWPLGRTVLWVVGWAVFVYATCGAPGIWGRVLFSTHMVMHMAIAMLVPLLLVPAAPVTLALRTLPARQDKTWGPRELILQVVHSRVVAVLSHPVVAAALFFVSLAVFYYSPAFELALSTHVGHLLMVAHFFLTGYLFTWVLVGTDPGPKRWPPLMLLVVLFATISFHAFFGVVLTGSRLLLAPDFFTALHLPWMTDPLADQRTAGEIAWGVGEAPTLVLAMMVAFAWVRSDRAEAARRDRQADRDGDAELAAYNAYLAQRKAQLEKGERR